MKTAPSVKARGQAWGMCLQPRITPKEAWRSSGVRRKIQHNCCTLFAVEENVTVTAGKPVGYVKSIIKRGG